VTLRQSAVCRKFNKSKSSRLGGTRKASALFKRKNNRNELTNELFGTPHVEEERVEVAEVARIRHQRKGIEASRAAM
jgi:hypothetical protein